MGEGGDEEIVGGEDEVMPEKEKIEWALDEADRMRVAASQYRQLGFIELARFLRKNADDARRRAAKKSVMNNGL